MKNSSSGLKRILLLATVLALLTLQYSAFGQTLRTSTGSTSWNSAGTWSPSGVPAAGDTVVIATGHTVTIDVTTASLDSLYIASGATLSFGSASGNLTLNVDNAPGNLTNDGTLNADDNAFAQHTIEISGDFDNSNGTFNGNQLDGVNPELIYVTFNGSGSMKIDGAPIFYRLTQSGSGTLSTDAEAITVTNGIDLQSGSFVAGSGAITLEGSIFNVLGTGFDATTNLSTIRFQGSTPPTLTVNGSNISTLDLYNCVVKDADLTVQANNADVEFRINNTLELNDFNIVFSGSGATESLAYSGSTSTLLYSGSTGKNVGNEWTSTVFPSNVTLNKSGQTMTVTSNNRTIPKTLTLTNGTLAMGSNNLTILGSISGSDLGGGGSVTSTGTIQMGDGTSTDHFSQTITGNMTLSNLTINKVGTKDTVSVTGSPVITNNLTLTNGELLVNGGSITISSGDLDINGGLAKVISGSVTISNAANKLSVASGSVFEMATGATSLSVDEIELLGNGRYITGGKPITGLSTLTLDPISTFEFNATGSLPSPVTGDYGNIAVSGGTVSAQAAFTMKAGADLALSGSSTFDLNDQVLTTSGSGRVLTIDSGSTLKTGTSVIYGKFDTNILNGTVNYDGTANQNLIDATYNNLVVAVGTDTLTVAGTSTRVTGIITFTSGIILSDASNTITLSATATANANTSSAIVGPVIRETNGSTTSFRFPVGYATSLRQVTINFVSPPATSNTITVEAMGAMSSPTSNLSGIKSVEDEGHWTVSTTLGTVPNYTMTVRTYGFSPSINASSQVTIVRGTNPTFNDETDTATNSSATQSVTASFTGGFSDFAIGNEVATKYWVTNGSGAWSTGSNWTGGTIPATGDAVVLDHSQSGVTNNYTVTLGGTNTANISSLTITPDGGKTIALSITSTNGSAVPLAISGSGTALTVNTGGTLTINAASGIAASGNGVNMSSDGDVQFGSGTSFNITSGTGIGTGGTRTFNATNTTTIGSSSANGALKSETYGVLNLQNSNTLNVTGNVSSQALTMSGTGDVNISGDLAVTGTLTKSNSSTITVSGALSTTVDLTVSAGTVTSSGASGAVTVSGNTSNSGTLNLNGNSASTFTGTYSGAGVLASSGSGGITFSSTFSPGGNATFGTQTVNLNGDVNLNGGSFSPASTTNFRGAVLTPGGGNLAATGTVLFNRTTGSQTLAGGSGTIAFNNLTINNSANVNFNYAVSVAGTLTLTNGLLTNNTNLLTLGQSGATSGASSASYVNGRLAKEFAAGAQSFTYPTGRGGEYLPVTLTYTNLSAGYTRAVEQVNSDANGVDTDLDASLAAISTRRHWYVPRIGASGANNGNTQITLTWTSTDGITNLTALDVAQLVSGTWTSLGGNGSGDETSGTIQSSAFTSSGEYFTFGDDANNGQDNALPVELAVFNVEADYRKVDIRWETQSEINNLGFNIYRAESTNPGRFSKINSELIPGRGTTSESTTYTIVDNDVIPEVGYTYYLESVSFQGRRDSFMDLSKTVTLLVPDSYTLLGNFPNPFNPTTNIRFQLPESNSVSIKIYDISGNLVKNLQINENYTAGEHDVIWNGQNESGQQVSSGMYIYQFISGKYVKIGKMMLIK